MGHIVNQHGICVDPTKVKAIQDWPIPQSVSEVQAFLGLANFYSTFVHQFAKMAIPLTDLLNQATPFRWNKEQNTAFNQLKRALSTTPVRCIPDLSQPFQLETDASGFALGAVLSQEYDGIWHPVAFESRKMSPAECNYPIHEQELLALVNALKVWRHYLLGSTITVYTDHQSLETFMDHKHLSRRQARWLEVLAEFDLHIVYRMGSQHIVADALSRRPDLCVAGISSVHPTFLTNFGVAYKDDPDFGTIFHVLTHPKEPTPKSMATQIRNFSLKDGILYYDKHHICVPKQGDLRSKLYHEFHDAQLAGHFGGDKVYHAMSGLYYWPRMYRDVCHYTRSCDACQRSKDPQFTGGLLQPLV